MRDLGNLVIQCLVYILLPYRPVSRVYLGIWVVEAPGSSHGAKVLGYFVSFSILMVSLGLSIYIHNPMNDFLA